MRFELLHPVDSISLNLSKVGRILGIFIHLDKWTVLVVHYTERGLGNICNLNTCQNRNVTNKIDLRVSLCNETENNEDEER